MVIRYMCAVVPVEVDDVIQHKLELHDRYYVNRGRKVCRITQQWHLIIPDRHWRGTNKQTKHNFPPFPVRYKCHLMDYTSAIY